MNNQQQNLFRSKFHFEASFRYEIFYALNILVDPKSRIHPNWKKSALLSLGKEFKNLVAEIGSSWEIWPVFAALLPGSLSNPTFDTLLNSMRDMPISNFHEKIIRGLIHSDEAVNLLLKDKVSLKTAIAKIPKAKREWVSHIDLFPYSPHSPQVIALEKLLDDPEQFRSIILRILEIFWEKMFKATWTRLGSQVNKSLAEHERLFHSCSFAEFAKKSLLRIEVNEEESTINALRGGYCLKFKDVEACYIMPSAFNDRRFWSAFQDSGDKTNVYFPYFDPSLTLELLVAGQAADLSLPPLDPALIFKALGDSTRFAIATILARAPTSSVELAKMLSVSKPTISHHVHLLREAGLLQENYINGSVELQLRREVFEKLSELTIAKLFLSDQPMILTRTRGSVTA